MKLAKILICIDWFSPAFKAGGPIKSVVNLVDSLKSEFDISIATSNMDLNEELSLGSIQLNQWYQLNEYRIIYLDKSHQSLRNYNELFLSESFDTVYLNSMFSINFTLLPLLLFRSTSAKIVLAPRGMLGIGALNYLSLIHI